VTLEPAVCSKRCGALHSWLAGRRLASPEANHRPDKHCNHYGVINQKFQVNFLENFCLTANYAGVTGVKVCDTLKQSSMEQKMTILNINLGDFPAEDATAILAIIGRQYKADDDNDSEGELLPWPKEGLAVFRNHNGKRYDAVAYEDGSIQFEGVTYSLQERKKARLAVQKAAGTTYAPSLAWWFRVTDKRTNQIRSVAKVYDCD
jgi:hypothetical protein